MSKRIGFIGLGNMGVPMALNLHKAGFYVTVYNRTYEKALPLQEHGLKVAQSLDDAVREKDIVITMLANDEAVEEIIAGDDGILDYIEAPTLLVDMSTVSPDTSCMLADTAKEMGITMLDAPVSGSVNSAETANLVILAGGPKEAFDTLQDVFQAMGKVSLYFGENGSGEKAKLVINLLLGMTMQGISESLVLAEKFGLDRNIVLDMIQQTTVATPFFGFKRELLAKEEYPAAFALKHMLKDFGLVLEQAHKNGSVLPATSAAYQSYASAANHGLKDMDMAAVFAELLHASGVKK
ncbi:NAD(P)-dependent oxidoreductase [Aneurinibacillus migulanus]|uniref:NAD(P)-dependent oxidoreductase n=1 Tax=Aneurinibacillus migulanus TaxID=47500 RepID=UPI002E1C9E48|nr:NAD(P)-dependent oxidoreductase [Aneurinibacillus migulanus]